MTRYDEIYGDLCVTMQKYSVDKIAALIGDNPTLAYFDWDTASEAHELPDTDLLGPSGMGFTDNGGLFDVIFSVGVSTVNDKNLFRLRKMAGQIYKDFVPDSVVPVYRHATGAPVSWLKITNPVVITPINRIVSRPLQFVMINAVLDPLAALRT